MKYGNLFVADIATNEADIANKRTSIIATFACVYLHDLSKSCARHEFRDKEMKNNMLKFAIAVVMFVGFFSSCCKSGYAQDLIPFKSEEYSKDYGKYGYKNAKGEIVIKPRFYHAEPFSEGMAVVGVKSVDERGKSIMKYGMINQKGEYVFEPEFDTQWDIAYHNGYFITPHCIFDRKGNKVKNKTLASKDSEDDDWFDDLTYLRGSDLVQVLVDGGKQSKFGLMRVNGKLVRKPSSFQLDYLGDEAASFPMPFTTDGTWSLMVTLEGGKWGYIDATGEVIIKPQFSKAWYFSDGLAMVKDKQGRVGYIDQTGKYVIKPKYDIAGSFQNGYAK